MTRTWRVFGACGRRQRISFFPSCVYDMSEEGKTCVVEVLNADRTGTNNYSVLRITCDTEEKCERELQAQLSRGLFKNSRFGTVMEIKAEEA